MQIDTKTDAVNNNEFKARGIRPACLSYISFLWISSIPSTEGRKRHSIR